MKQFLAEMNSNYSKLMLAWNSVDPGKVCLLTEPRNYVVKGKSRKRKKEKEVRGKIRNT